MVLMTSCDTDKGKPTTDPALFAQKLTFPFNTPKVKGQAAITMLRDHVRDLILLRQRNQEGDLFDLTYYYITPRGFSNLDRRVGPDAFAGFWAKFKKDYTYEYGIRQEKIGSGIYHYGGSDDKLFMLDDDEQIEPKMWSLLSNSDFFNFLGHPIILIEDSQGNGQVLMNNFANDGFLDQQHILAQANNGMQIMMTKVEGRPTQ